MFGFEHRSFTAVWALSFAALGKLGRARRGQGEPRRTLVQWSGGRFLVVFEAHNVGVGLAQAVLADSLNDVGPFLGHVIEGFLCRLLARHGFGDTVGHRGHELTDTRHAQVVDAVGAFFHARERVDVAVGHIGVPAQTLPEAAVEMAVAVRVHTEAADLQVVEGVGLVGEEAQEVEGHFLVIRHLGDGRGPPPSHVGRAVGFLEAVPRTCVTVPDLFGTGQWGCGNLVADAAFFLLGLNEGVIPRVAHQRLTAPEGEDLVAQTIACATRREGFLRVDEQLKAAHEARSVDQRLHGLEIEEEAPRHVGVFGVGCGARDEGGEHQVVAFGDLGGAVVVLTVAVPVKTREIGRNRVVVFPCLRDRKLFARVGEILRFQLLILENVGAVLQVVAVAIHRILHHFSVPRRHAFEAVGDIRHAARCGVGFGHGGEETVEIADPQRGVEQHIIGVLAALERDHDALEQIAERHVDDVDLGACEDGELLGVKSCWLADHGDGVGDDIKRAARVVFGVDRGVITGARQIFFNAKRRVIGGMRYRGVQHARDGQCNGGQRAR
mmetsp:Transcript_26973/g.34627  ORF Transcript_26973/g.34627 Transcript_26973/m.34627 type:complete len:552 (-) Transcript_26973:2025-3680(-)